MICNDCQAFTNDRCTHPDGRRAAAFWHDACGLFAARQSAAPAPADELPTCPPAGWKTPPAGTACPMCSGVLVMMTQDGVCWCWSCKHGWRP